MLCSDWLGDSTLDADWSSFSHVKKAVREADWTIAFFTLDYEQSLFPLRDSRGKRTSERARKSPASLKRDPRVLTTLAARHARHISTRQAMSRSLTSLFSSTISERKEGLLSLSSHVKYSKYIILFPTFTV